MLKCLFQHKSCLRHRPFGSIDEQKYAVRHRQHPFDFAAEIRVARGVDQIDFRDRPVRRGVGVIDGDILGQNRDAPLALQRIAVQQRVLRHLAVAKVVALTQQRVDEGGLAVIDVSDNRDVSNVISYVGHWNFQDF